MNCNKNSNSSPKPPVPSTLPDLRNIPTKLRKGKGYELGMFFTTIPMKSQDALIKFIFERQRILIKKDK
jgi:hypothetical protein